MELSSNNEEMVSTINKEVSNTGHHSKQHAAPDTQCSICLDDLSNKCFSNSCAHLFCFECLKRWSNTEPTCPLCKKVFIRIYHTFADQGVHETYNVPQEITQNFSRETEPSTDQLSNVNRMNTIIDAIQRNDFLNNIRNFVDNNSSNARTVGISVPSINPGVQTYIINRPTRTQVYIENVWADPLPDACGRFRDISADFYRNNPAEINRLHGFILEDIVAVRGAIIREGRARTIIEANNASITNLIIRSISIYEIRGSFMVNTLLPFLAEHTRHFCHELYNYANSPFDRNDYDNRVQYSSLISSITTSSAPIFPLTIRQLRQGVGSHFDRPIVISRYSSETNGSNETIPYNPIENPSSSFMDQPSTSTGIRDSFNQPNNRRRRLGSSTISESSSVSGHVSQIAPDVGRGRSILDSSSDNEELTTASQTQARMKSLKKRKKKN